jgi:hypothetical protein
MMHRATTRGMGVRLGCALSICLCAPPTHAQPLPADEERVPLARFVPASATCFFTTAKLDEINRVLHRSRVCGLLPLLEEWTSGPDRTFDLRELLVQLIGEQRSIPIDELTNRELAAVAPSWSRLDQAVWLFRVPEEGLIDRWFPPGDRAQEDDTGQMRFFSVADDIIVCVRDDVLAMGRRSVGSPFLGETMALMASLRGSTLENSAAFDQLTMSLPPQPLGMLYVAHNAAKEGSERPLSSLAPKPDQAVVGFYHDANRLELALRTLPPQTARPVVADYAVEQLLKLPRATSLAWATTMDPKQTFASTADNPSARAVSRYLRLLEGLISPEQLESGLLESLGPNLLLVWNPNLRTHGAVPQVAVMIECANPQAVRDEAELVAGRILALLEAVDPGASRTKPRIQTSRYFGTRIVQIPLGEYAARSNSGVVKLLGQATPCFAAIDRWFVFAMSPEHIHRILRSNNGLATCLNAVPEIRRACERYRPSRTLGVAQPGLAAGIIKRWLTDFDEGTASLLDPKWWQATEAPIKRKLRRFGIGMKARQRPGVVVVAVVYPGTASDGLLKPGDRIVGVDRQLLAMDRPNADLRRRLRAAPIRPGPVLRVLRDDALIDVRLVIPDEPEVFVSDRWTPAGLLRDLAAPGDAVGLATFAAEPDCDDYYAAHLVLQLNR